MDTKTTKEVSEITGLTQGYTAELCAAGKIPGAIKRGKMWFIPEETLKIYKITHPRRDKTTTERKSAEAELASVLKENEARADVS